MSTSLDEIIPATRTRALFERFLAPGRVWGTPTTTHPKDIKRLDVFICGLYRYRAHVDLAALRNWLIDEGGWPDKNANWTCTRIEVGLDVLGVNRRF
jgi:hypothetical protein